MSWINEIKNIFQSLDNYKNTSTDLVDFTEDLEEFKNKLIGSLKGDFENPPIIEYILKIKECKNLHHSIHVESQSLTKSYNEWSEFITGESPNLPTICKPIYFISNIQKIGYKLGDDVFQETVLYVGKTNVSESTKSGRFTNGHAAISKLHHPQWFGDKKLYLA